MHKLLILLATMALFLSHHEFTQQKPGPIILAGGGKLPKEIFQWMSQRVKSNFYLVITTDVSSAKLKWINIVGTPIFILPEDFSKMPLTEVSAIIIDGGDQWHYLTRLDGKHLQKAHESGILIMGTSAGAMILGEYYFTAEKGTITSLEAATNDHKICIGKGFTTIKLLKGFIVDTHYRERERQGRLKIFIEKSGAEYGMGIDESTAFVIDNQDKFIIGSGGVQLVKK